MSNSKLEEAERRAKIVVKDYEGIIPFNEAFYLQSILYSAKKCLDSFSFYEHLKTIKAQPSDLIGIVQEAVGHAAALSRYFWPSPSGKSKGFQKQLKVLRGEKLCKYFELNQKSPLFNRSIRNAWEHFDERLDQYLLTNISGTFMPNSIIGNHTIADCPENHIFKLLDIEHECLILLNHKYFFSPLREEVGKIYKQALIFSKNGDRFSY